MKLINKFARAANALLMVFTAVMAAIMLVSSLYVLNDIYYTNRMAFVSYDLLKYRPVAQTNGEKDNSFDDLKKINPDTVGWIELFGTHVNYPVVQGKDNLEYLNKDIFGYNTLSGSIYLAAENDPELSDWYNLIYGHHMENGAMFGDIEKYLDPEYFHSHSDGILQTERENYRIHIFACVRTNAYEDAVYQLSGDAESRYPLLKKYIAEHQANSMELEDSGVPMQILGMSTCSDAVTDGRIVLFAALTPWDETTDGAYARRMTKSEEPSGDPEQQIAEGHKLQNSKWSFLNLMCVICVFLTLLPLWAVRKKYGQLSYSSGMIRKLEKQRDEKNHTEEDEELLCDLRRFLRKCRMGIVIEAVILILAIVVFLMTEDLTGRMSIRDSWTGPMILIAGAALLVDCIFLRYRGKRPEEDRVEDENEEKVRKSVQE